ncbi:MAG: universal stress protein, partial [Bacteroidetes bacterium]|nr:universal stress protein [Bacteroidota bacterium]
MENEFNNIVLVPTDFSDICQNAIDHGTEIAEYLNFKLVVLHVIKEELPKDVIIDNLQNIIHNIKKNSNVQAEFLIKEGNIFNEIHKTATDIGAKLMMLGTHGKKGLQYLFGSHAFKVITKSPVPTIVVQKKGFNKGYKKIVFPINDFTEARQQVQWSMLIAKSFGSEILIFQQPHKDPGIASKIKIASQQIEEAFNNNGIKFEIKIADKASDFADQLIGYAVSNNADLMVIMTSPDIFSPDFRSGQWSEEIMFNKAQIPVMCINPILTG